MWVVHIIFKKIALSILFSFSIIIIIFFSEYQISYYQIKINIQKNSITLKSNCDITSLSYLTRSDNFCIFSYFFSSLVCFSIIFCAAKIRSCFLCCNCARLCSRPEKYFFQNLLSFSYIQYWVMFYLKNHMVTLW